jgi:hypothetical protein
MFFMRKMIFALAAALMLPLAALAQTADPAKAAKAQEILKQARAAIGDESKLKGLQSLSASGTFRRAMGDRETNGEVALDLLMPDKILLSATTLAPFEFTLVTALNGEQFWNDVQSPMGGPGGGGGMRRMMGGDDPQMRERMQNNQRADLTRLALALVLAPPSSVPLQYSYAGDAQTPDGKADVIDVTGPNGFNARLIIDQKTHQLFMLSYKGKQPQRMMRGGPGGPGRQGGGQGGPGGQGGQRPQLTPEELEKIRKERQEAYEKAPEVEFQWVLADYKSVGGLNLPHRITRGEAGTPNEEWEITKYKINPSIKPDKFEKKDKSQT